MRKSLVLVAFLLAAIPAFAANKTFNITAKQFQFITSPADFSVNVGDNVTLIITSTDVTHGFLMEHYSETAKQLQKNKPVTITFTANQAGDFVYFCTESTCGVGHTNMDGVFHVNQAVVSPPTIASITPTNGPVNGGTIVLITGTNFQNGATVKFGALNAVSVNFQDASHVTAASPAQGAGTVTLTLTNPDGQSATSSYTYNVLSPSVSAVSPATGSTAGGSTITINGANFQSGAAVTIGGVAAMNVTVVDSNTITAVTPMGPTNEQATQPRDIVVTNPDSQTGVKTGAFAYFVPPPAISAITPGSGVPGGGAVVDITGAGFTTAVQTTVTFGGVAATSVSVVDAITLRITAPAHAKGAVDVAVKVGNTTVTALNGFNYADSLGKKRATKR